MAKKPATKPPTFETAADLQRHLGGIPLKRIRLRPAPGTATEKALVALLDAVDRRLCEPVDGVLVEKALHQRAAILGGVVSTHLLNYLDGRDLGVVVGAAAPIRLLPGQVRLPSVAFVSWDRLGDRLPPGDLLGVVPELVVEMWNKGNTRRELERKIRDYFQAGVQVVWVIDHQEQRADVYRAPEQKRTLTTTDALDCEGVLPGYSLPLKQLFAYLNRRRPAM